MVGFCGGVAAAENRVVLSQQKDHNGMPLAHVVHAYPQELLAMRSYLEQQGRKVVEAAGAREAWTVKPAVGHVTGGTIMGGNAENSVTDSFGLCHDVPNLVLAGSGLFPCNIGVSPTYTIMAVASRSADHLIQNWSSLVV
jgi:choline dehydrogenase-like flavoprotein